MRSSRSFTAMIGMPDLRLSQKYKAFLRCNAPVEFLEGTTAAGKTTVGLFKFMLRIAESEKKIHILSGLDLGTIEKNIISKELGILDDFGDLVRYWPSGHGAYALPHLEFLTSSGVKIVYVLGYDNKSRWKKALGGQYGCVYIDEINIAGYGICAGGFHAVRLSHRHAESGRSGASSIQRIRQPQPSASGMGEGHAASDQSAAYKGTKAGMGSLVFFF